VLIRVLQSCHCRSIWVEDNMSKTLPTELKTVAKDMRYRV
jgi:hypothetical protein